VDFKEGKLELPELASFISHFCLFIPAEAGIWRGGTKLDPRLRGDDTSFICNDYVLSAYYVSNI